MLHKNVSISITRCKFCSFRTTLYCFWKFILTVKGSRWVEEGKCVAHPHEGQEEVLESYKLVSLALVPRKVMKDSQDDHKFSWKTFPDMSKTRRWLEQPAKIQQGQIMLHQTDWILWLGPWLSGWGGNNAFNLSWLKQGFWHGIPKLWYSFTQMGKRWNGWVNYTRCCCKVCGNQQAVF